MVAWSLDSLSDVDYSQIIFVVLKEHEDNFGICERVKRFCDDRASFVLIDRVTDGQLCTVLSARDCFNPNEGLLIGSCDTFVQSNIGSDIRNLDSATRGLISVANLPGDKWSFARTDKSGRVVEVAEKTRISDFASTGLYYFSNSEEFLSTADDMILRDERTRGEFYVIPVYQKYIETGREVRISTASETWDMGTPEALVQAAVRFSPQTKASVAICAE